MLWFVEDTVTPSIMLFGRGVISSANIGADLSAESSEPSALLEVSQLFPFGDEASLILPSRTGRADSSA